MSATAAAHILVVEDDPFSQDMLVRRLRSRGFDASAVSDGQACLDRVRADAASGAAPDLVLLDVNLPDRSGLDVLAGLRQAHGRDALPVILVTALGETADVVAGLEAGANDYVVKPINLPVLLARMSVWLKVRQSIELLMEAERDRVMLETLGRACEQVAQPMTAITVLLEMLVRQPLLPEADALRAELREVLTVTRDAGELIHRLRAVATARTVPYTERLAQIGRGGT